jgi:hypothetical protein
MTTKIFFTDAYSASLEAIEDFIYESVQDLSVVAAFLDEHDRALQFIADNPGTPAVHPTTGDQSWPFGEGRYRLFFKVVRGGAKNAAVYMTHTHHRQPAGKSRGVPRKFPADVSGRIMGHTVQIMGHTVQLGRAGHEGRLVVHWASVY